MKLTQQDVEKRLSEAVSQATGPVAVMGPYVRVLDGANRQLRERVQRSGHWWIPSAQGQREEENFAAFLGQQGVQMTYMLCGDAEADRDLSPYVVAWRILRGEMALTPLGREQFSRKPPFAAREAA